MPVAAEGETAAVRVTLAPVVVLVEEDESTVVVAVGEPPPPPPPQDVPLTAKLVGTALVVPFQVPLKPMPVLLPPAAMLPL